MRRVLITGAVCLATGYAVAAVWPEVAKDIGRYNKIRAMSNQGTLASGLLENLPALGVMAFQAFSNRGKNGQDRGGSRTSVFSLIPDLGKDITRYNKIRSM